MTAFTAAPARIDVHPARPARSRHLVSVPTGDAVPERATTSLRLTRRGRLAITVTTMLVASVAGATVAFGGQATTPQQVTVEPGQTLGQIAEAELSQLPTREAVARLQVTNDLSTSHVHAGQVLTIPAP